MTQSLNIGDILHGSWGYDQTQCEYFQVVGLTPKGFILREMAQTTVPNSEGFMCDQRLPVKDTFTGDRGEIKARFNKWGALAIPVSPKAKTRVHLSKWEGKPQYCSWYA
jgi:hypothetical protein